jgi:hypothetical protein
MITSHVLRFVWQCCIGRSVRMTERADEKVTIATPRRHQPTDEDPAAQWRVTAAALPAEPGGCRGPRSLQLVRRTRAERGARTGDLLQITKALLIRER